VKTQYFGKVVSVRHKPGNANAVPSNSTRQIAFGGRGLEIPEQRLSSGKDSILAVVMVIREGVDRIRHAVVVTVGLIDVGRTVSRLQDSDRPVVDKTGNEQRSKERIVARRREYIDRSADTETVFFRDPAGVGNTVAVRIGQLDPDHALRAVPD